MSLNVTSSSVNSTTSTSQVSGSQPSDNTLKSSTDSSFKDEMEKVSTKEDKPEKDVEKVNTQDTQKTEKTESGLVKAEKPKLDNNTISDAERMKLAALSMIDVNNNLQNDIERMMNTNGFAVDELTTSLLSSVTDETLGSLYALDYTDSMYVSQSDAEFFINLAQNNDVSAQAVAAQAQMAFENGAELSQVQQNVKISETLLNAINIARENNQPLRIDFDQNIAVILRFGKDGSFAANFIPGDKAVEQYLKNNLDSLKSAFQEKDIPYTDLSYSNRGRKHQKEEQRSQQQ